MIEVQGTDGKKYCVVTKRTFQSWVRRVSAGFALLAIGVVLGVYAMTDYSKESLKNKINTFAEQSCLAQRSQVVLLLNTTISSKMLLTIEEQCCYRHLRMEILSLLNNILLL